KLNINNQKFAKNDVLLFYTKMLFSEIPLYDESIFDDVIPENLLESFFIKSAAEKFGISIDHGEWKKIKYLKLIINDAIHDGSAPSEYLMHEKIWSKEEIRILKKYSDSMRKDNFINIFSSAGLLE
ncbi:hypothetical protein KKC22_20325, partial [Myxococcota bacterium]|nr:hypothetical protein [Myxococcota bacterium]